METPDVDAQRRREGKATEAFGCCVFNRFNLFRMRAKSSTRGDGSPVGVHVSTADGWNGIAASPDHGPHFRGQHAGRNQSTVPSQHAEQAAVVLPGSRGGRSSSGLLATGPFSGDCVEFADTCCGLIGNERFKKQAFPHRRLDVLFHRSLHLHVSHQHQQAVAGRGFS